MVEEWEQRFYYNPYRLGESVYFKEGIYQCLNEFNFHSPEDYIEGWRLMSGIDKRKHKVIENNTPQKSIRKLVDDIAHDRVHSKPNKIVAPDDWDEF